MFFPSWDAMNLPSIRTYPQETLPTLPGGEEVTSDSKFDLERALHNASQTVTELQDFPPVLTTQD